MDVAGATLDFGKTQEIKNTTRQIKHTEWLGSRSGSYSIDKIAIAILNCLEPNHGFSAVLLPADTIAFTLAGMWGTN